MRNATLVPCVAVALIGSLGSARHARSKAKPIIERIASNSNRTAAGTPGDGVLTIRLEAREGEWHPDRDDQPGIVVHAFGEEGSPLLIPGPLIRVNEGTKIHAFVRNLLRDSTLIVHGLGPRGAMATADSDTIQVRPDSVREVTFDAGVAGTYYYWATTSVQTFGVGPMGRPVGDAELTGAFIIDPRGTVAGTPPRDRVLVINLWDRTPHPGGVLQFGDVLRFTINGRTWPNTERFTYSIGDTVRLRIVNPTFEPHPMHLHGFYFNVESRGDGVRDTTYGPTSSPRRVVTERVAPGHTFTMSWVPERPGYWLFHCHDNVHALRNIPLDGSPLPPEQDVHAHNHALEMMGGLVMSIEVRDRGAVQAAREPSIGRRLRLIARVDDGGTREEPAYGYVLQDEARPRPAGARGSLLPAPTIVLKRGQQVSITVVNEIPEATSVHWHGIELDSYYDGVADYSGHPGRVAAAIAPHDSFEAKFTPPRAGTFIYHPHADELRQQVAGMSGAIVVVDDLAMFDPETDIVMLLTSPRRSTDATRSILLNGSQSPPMRELHVGTRYRLRLVDIHPVRPSMIARLLSDSTPVMWRAIAKDGMTLPADQATMRPAIQQMGNGETYDYEVIPSAPGAWRFTVTTGVGDLLASMPIRVR
jgi:FtsP/CotA-like multicopper oxidase with cupredoxin domain